MPYKDPKKRRASARKSGKKWRQKNPDYQKEWRANNKDYFKNYNLDPINMARKSVHDMLNSYVRMGIVKKEPCSVCGNTNSQGHHNDYTKPLEVTWLCSKHHMKLHRIDGKPAYKPFRVVIHD